MDFEEAYRTMAWFAVIVTAIIAATAFALGAWVF